ncbi:EamA family transporter [Erythrobacter aureus]|uniref:EamA family transporter n=1 Tax=Erythrobacter aureus TaxID=2182384 RepID=A0A345YBK0_9SPHN|nr:EamA family transporter [Erythrobacter aureus]AXK41302.1 EamA family transporter [Erythrobacter aureus]
MTGRDIILVMLVMFVWGTNFVVIHEALLALPPLLFATIRFVIAFFPAVLFVPRPSTSWLNLSSYGVLVGVGQFGILFIAMDGMISPGLASLIIQAQVFFTIGLSVWLTGERVRGVQIAALLLATAGIVLIGVRADGGTTAAGVGLVLVAAASWALANMISRKTSGTNVLGFVVWSSIAPVPVLLALSFMFEGWSAMAAGFRSATLSTWAAVIWQSLGNTLFGYGIWAALLNRYPSATVAPFALLVPVFGLSASALLLAEPLPAWKVIASMLVMAGLLLGLTGPQLSNWAGKRFGRKAGEQSCQP